MEYEEIKKLMDDMGNSKLSSLDIEFPDGIKISMAKTVQKDISVVTAERITPTVVEIDSTKDKKQKEESCIKRRKKTDSLTKRGQTPFGQAVSYFV